MDGWVKRLGFYDMGKDIDRNITRQLLEKETGVTGDVFTKNDIIPVENGGTGVNNLELFTQKLNVFTKNDVIPVENGGTGVTNINDIVSFISNGAQYIKTIKNTYKNEKIDKVINSSIDINSNSILLRMVGNYKVTGYEINTPLILAVFQNTGFMPNVRCSARYGIHNATISLYDGTITISIEASNELTTLNANNYGNFFSFPL